MHVQVDPRHRGVSRQYISQLAKAGVLVMRGGKVDVAASDAVLDDKPVPVEPDQPVQGARTGGIESRSQQPTSFAQARLADMVFRAKLRRLEFETRQGKLIEAELVKQRWAAILVVLKERLLATPDKLAPELTALAEERQVRDALKREMHAVLKAIHSDINMPVILSGTNQSFEESPLYGLWDPPFAVGQGS
ncbi:MAG: hypothetical protein HY648_05355 [Acidobacteria bacterium]|nr:hypothetical protein [Acidobacteriota bacterium]